MSSLHIFVLILVIGLEARREGESSFALCTRGLSLQCISTWGKCYFLLARVELPLESEGSEESLEPQSYWDPSRCFHLIFKSPRFSLPWL